MYLFYLTIIVIISILNGTETKDRNPPNIIIIVNDDLGFNDVPWHDNTNTHMPYLQQFVTEKALKIDTFYSMPLCSMTRSALLTGRYNMRYGLQSWNIENGYPFGLSIFESIMTRDLKDAGFKTYMIGKWHLGFHRNDLTPLQRGFDEFRGSLSSMIHYFDYDYTVEANDKEYPGFDLWMNENKVSSIDTNAEYLTDWECDQFIDILNDIASNDPNGEEPFFMYVGMHASHDPREATDECLGLYYTTDCIDREFEELMDCEQHQIFQAQSSCGDKALQRMLQHLQNINNGNIWSNTLLIWMSDNGSPLWDGDNSPLRGGKKALYEGGLRTPAFVSGGYLNSERYGKIFKEHTPFHVVDWFPTIMASAGITTNKALDGVNQWDAIQYNIVSEEASGSKREFLYNVDPLDCDSELCGAYRYGPYKFISAQLPQDMVADEMYWCDFYAINARRNEDGSWNTEYSNYLECGNIPDGVKYVAEYDEDGVLIGNLPCNDEPCIFDIVRDPCEYNDLSSDKKYENLYMFMYNMLMAYYESQSLALRAYYDKFDVNSDPALTDGYWSPWIRDYNAEDDIVDFEDLIITQDVTLSEYYAIAMKYKVKWDEEVDNGILIEDDIDVSNVSLYKGNLQEFEILMIITVVVILVILIGFALLCIQWGTTCCRGTSQAMLSQVSLYKKNTHRGIASKRSNYGTNDVDSCDKSLEFGYIHMDRVHGSDFDESDERVALLKK